MALVDFARLNTVDCPQELPRVSQIIEATMAESDRAALAQWQSKPSSPRQEYDAQQRGESIDRWAKAILLDQFPPELDFRWHKWKVQLEPLLLSWKANYKIDADVQVCDRQRGYRGTLDILLVQDWVWTLVDLKTRSFCHPAALERALLQCTAYKEAFESQYGQQIKYLLVVTVLPSRVELSQVVEVAQLQALSERWQECLSLYQGWSYE